MVTSIQSKNQNKTVLLINRSDIPRLHEILYDHDSANLRNNFGENIFPLNFFGYSGYFFNYILNT